MKIIFMSSGGIGVEVFQRLLQSEHQIIAVYTNPPKPSDRGKLLKNTVIHEIAIENNINVITPTSFKNDEIKKQFLQFNADLSIIVSYGKILPDYVINHNYGAINLHPSKLPRWRGAAPVERAIEAGDNKFDICTMFLTKELDSGDIIERKSFKIDNNMNSDDLYKIIDNDGGEMILNAVTSIENNTVKRETQNSSGITYANKIEKHELEILPKIEDVVKIYNKIRAFVSYGGCYIMINNEKIKILSAEIEYTSVDTDKIGTVDSNFRIFCKNGIVLPKMVQRSGKKPVYIEDFLRGWRF